MLRTGTFLLVSVVMVVGAFGVLGAGAGAGCFAAAPYMGPISDHFDGKRFHNPSGPEPKGLAEVIRWKLNSEAGPWQEWTEAPPGPPPPRKVESGELHVTFVNHASVLVQMDALNILTDPIWSERASPFSWLGPKRVRPVGIKFEDLPHIDVVLVSHNHYDHLDLPTLKRLADAHQPRMIVPLGNRGLLAEQQIGRVEELDWWKSIALSDGVRVSAVPAQHFSQRGPFDRDASLWAGYVIASEHGAVYFAGDTAWGPHFEQIRARFPRLRLALLPIGAFEPRWFMQAVHINPEESLAAHRALGAETSMAMHFGTFALADDGQREAPDRLLAALAKAGEPAPRFWVLGFGEGRTVPPLGEPAPAPADAPAN